MASFSARQENHCPKRIFPLDSVKLGLEILYLFLAEKMVVAILCPILAFFFFNCSTHRAEKDALKENSS